VKRHAAWLGLVLVGLTAVGADDIVIAPGVVYRQLTRPGPVVVHVLKAALGETGVSATVAAGGPLVTEAQPLTTIAARLTAAAGAGAAVVAGGINGGFGLSLAEPAPPAGLLLVDGELLCDPWPAQRSCLVITDNGTPRIECPTLHGTVTGADARPFPLAGLNRPRLPGELVLYAPRYGVTTRGREAGRQIVLGKVFAQPARVAPGVSYSGEVVSTADGLSAVTIPGDGVVLAGSGASEAWLSERKVGERVAFRFVLSPDLGPLRAALGAGPRLVRDGKVAVEADQEELGVRVNLGKQPRSAVGVGPGGLYLVAVDGRAPDYSVGLALEDLAALLVELGCTQAMELDGGGATTLFVRDRVVNRPSDGAPRALCSALLVLTSGKLTDVPLPNPTIAAVGPVPNPGGGGPTVPVIPPVTTVGPGGATLPPLAGSAARLSVTPTELMLAVGETIPLSLAAANTEGRPVAIDLTKVAYEVTPAGLGEVDGKGRFVAKREGAGRVTVRYGDKSQTLPVRVAKTAAPVTPPKPPVTPPVKPPVAPPTGGPLRPGQGVERPRPQLPPGEWRQLDAFEDEAAWKLRVFPAEVVASSELVREPKREGKTALKLSYDFATVEVNRAAYLLLAGPDGKPKVIGSPKAVSLWVFGDGNGHWLRGRLIDKTGARFTVTFTEYVNWDHYWARCSALVPKEAQAPLTWECVYLCQYRPEAKTAGAIFVDDFQGLY